MSTRLLVCGGAGFIGSNFVRAQAASGAELLVLDKLTYAGHRASLADVLSLRVRLVEGDIADAALVDALLAEFQPNALVNFAAETHVDRSIDSPAPFLRSNVEGVFVLLEAARRWLRAGPRPGFRFLHVSTDEVYGDLPAPLVANEDHPFAPNSPYAASKAAADHLVRAWSMTYDLPVLTTHCSNNYGPYQYPEKLIPLMLLNALEARPLPVYGDGGQRREWLLVQDHCDALAAVLARGRPGERYNIGAPVSHTNLEVVQALCTALELLRPAARNPAMQRAGMRRYADLITHVPDRPGHDRRYALDSRRIRDELGWTATTSFKDGLAATTAWYLRHEDWCQAVTDGRYGRERLGLGAAA
jgi:dTDP-glucose 4,6-dehydratase